jgi:hypothetical protein
MLTNFSPVNKVSLLALTKIIPEVKKTSTIAELAQELNVSLSSELRNRQLLIQKINQIAPVSNPSSPIPEYVKTIIT